jgi:hypothetical protein
MKPLNSAIGWTQEQWIAALQFYDKPCETIEEFLACRIFWWAYWENPPCSAQLYFIKTRVAHRDMASRLFQDLAPLLCSHHLDTD